MNKKNLYVNLIIFLIFLFFNTTSVFATKNSLKLNELKLTPIIISPTIIEDNLFNNIFNNFNNQKDNNSNNQNEDNQTNQKTISYSKTINGLVYYTQYGNYYLLPKTRWRRR